jgi:cyanophycin synthetase
MQVLSKNIYVGPSVYAKFPVIRYVIDIGALEYWPSVKLGKGFVEGLINALPSLETHGCSYGVKGGFIRRLREGEGTWIGHIWEHATLELQNIAGADVSFGKTRLVKGAKPGLYNMIFEYKQEDVGLRASTLAKELLLHLLPDEVKSQMTNEIPKDFDFEHEKIAFIKFAQSKQFGPSTQSLIDAAVKRGIPYIRLNNHSLVQLGHGKYQQRIRATITSQTNDIAVDISCDKGETNNLLGALGLPVPKQYLVRYEDDAVLSANKLGYPVVVKPLDGNHGRGISIDLKSDEAVKVAFGVAKEVSTSVLIEKFITGFDHRMCVVAGKLVAVAKRIPGHVIGDGKHTIKELVDIVNEDPRRGVGHEKVLTRLELDYQAKTLITNAGYKVDTVLKSGELLYLRDTANLSTGGTAIDVTDIVHPDNRDMAQRAVLAVGLDVGGVDFLSPDISQSYLDVGGAVCEINAAPGFRMHVHPSEGTPRDVAGAVMDMLFPNPNEARIPIAAITGTNGKTTTSRMVAHMWKLAGKIVGLTTTDGIYVNGRLTVEGDTTGPVSARMILRDPSVDLAVFETARGGLLRSGLGYDYCNVGACINISEDHLGNRGIDTLSDLAGIKRVVIEASTDTAVLNADDIECLKMSAYTKAKKIVYVTANSEHGLVKEHIRSGGCAITLEHGVNGSMITIYDNNVLMHVLWTHLIPATIEGKAMHNVQNAMFAVAICYSMDMSLDDIKNGLLTFTTNYSHVPGRLNIFDEYPFKVLMDYAHNPAAIKAIGELVQKIDVRGVRTVVIGAPGDRRDEDIQGLSAIAAKCFDNFIIKEDADLRGRSSGEVSLLIKNALLNSGVKKSAIAVFLSEKEAINNALENAKAGDLVTVLVENVRLGWKQIIHFKDGKTYLNDAKNHLDNQSVNIKSELSAELNALIKNSMVSDGRGVRLGKLEEASD